MDTVHLDNLNGVNRWPYLAPWLGQKVTCLAESPISIMLMMMRVSPFPCWQWRRCLLWLPVWRCTLHPHSVSGTKEEKISEKDESPRHLCLIPTSPQGETPWTRCIGEKVFPQYCILVGVQSALKQQYFESTNIFTHIWAHRHSRTCMCMHAHARSIFFTLSFPVFSLDLKASPWISYTELGVLTCKDRIMCNTLPFIQAKMVECGMWEWVSGLCKTKLWHLTCRGLSQSIHCDQCATPDQLNTLPMETDADLCILWSSNLKT